MTLVWDFSRGDVIDEETGEVIDRIYIPEVMREREINSAPNTRCRALLRLKPETKAWLRLMNEKKRKSKLSKAVIKLDNVESMIKEKRRVKTFEVPLPSKPDELTTRVVDKVISKYPVLNSRTLRGKYTIAAILVSMVVHRNQKLRTEALAHQFGVSRQHVLRMVKLLNNLPYKEKILKEVREMIV